jgi:hypothetical protein
LPLKTLSADALPARRLQNPKTIAEAMADFY